MNESDWKLFRARTPEWRERYVRARNAEIQSLLTDGSKTETERFWAVDEKVQKVGRILRDCLDGHKRSRMFEYLVLMKGHGMITKDDLREFSAELNDDLFREWR